MKLMKLLSIHNPEGRFNVLILSLIVVIASIVLSGNEYKEQTDARDLSIPIQANPVTWNNELSAIEQSLTTKPKSVYELYEIQRKLDVLAAQAQKLRVLAPEMGSVAGFRPGMQTNVPRSREDRVTKVRAASDKRLDDYLKSDTSGSLMFDYSAQRYWITGLSNYELRPTTNLQTDWWPILQWPLGIFLFILAFGMVLVPFHYRAQILEQGCRFDLELRNPLFWLAVPMWPALAWVYPNTTPAKQMALVRRYLAWAFSPVVSIAGFVLPAAAQVESPTPTPIPTRPTSKTKTKVTVDVDSWSESVADNAVVFSKSPFISNSVTIERGQCNVSFGYSQTLIPKANQPDGATVLSVTGACWAKKAGWKFTGYGSYMNGQPFTSRSNDAVLIGVSVSSPKKNVGRTALQVFANLDHFIGMPRSGVSGGTWLTAGSTVNHKLNSRFTISVTSKMVYDTGTFGYARSVVASVNPRLEFAATKNFTWRVLQLHGVIPLSKLVDGRKSVWALGTGASYAW